MSCLSIQKENIDANSLESKNLHSAKQQKVESLCTEDFVFIHLINVGSFGWIYKVLHRKSGKEYALKMIPKEDLSDEKVREFRQEIHTHGKIKSDFCAMLHSTFQDDNSIFLLMELCQGLDLSELLGLPEFELEETDVQTIIASLIFALRDLKDQSVVHRDLKP